MAPKKGKAAPENLIFREVEDNKHEAVAAKLATEEGAAAVIALRNRDGWSPLHAACYHGSLDCVKLLVSAGSDLYLGCKDGDLPVHYASAQGELTCAAELITKGGSRMLTVTDQDGETPLDVAQSAKMKRGLEKLGEEADAVAEAEEEEAGEEGEVEEGVGKLALDK
jgi:hypothetical protein